MLVTAAIARRERPELPAGRRVVLPGRGQTWVRDDVVPTRFQVSLAEAIPGATLRFVPGGHHLCVTDPVAFAPAISDACREVVGRSSAASTSGDGVAAGVDAGGAAVA